MNIAIYFAIENHLNIRFNNECGLYVSEKSVNYDDLLSVYAIKLKNNSPGCPIMIEDINHSIPNARAKNQQGVLCTFSNPCSYYMEHGQFPKIESYLINGKNDHFIFKKLSLARSVNNLDFLSAFLTKENINKELIYPDRHE